MHAALLVDPDDGFFFPAAHALQVEPGVESWYLPGAQSVQVVAPELENVPAEHSEQTVAPERGMKRPDAHRMHVLDDVAPVDVEYLPEGQVSQAEDPVEGS